MIEITKDGLTRRDFLKTLGAVGGATALALVGGVKLEPVSAQGGETKTVRREDLESIDLKFSEIIEGDWGIEFTDKKYTPELRGIKTKEGQTIGVELTAPLSLVNKANELIVGLGQNSVTYRGTTFGLEELDYGSAIDEQGRRNYKVFFFDPKGLAMLYPVRNGDLLRSKNVMPILENDWLSNIENPLSIYLQSLNSYFEENEAAPGGVGVKSEPVRTAEGKFVIKS